MASVYDQISELNEMCRKLEAMNLAELSVPMRAKIAELAVPAPAVHPEPGPIVPEAPAPASTRGCGRTACPGARQAAFSDWGWDRD